MSLDSSTKQIIDKIINMGASINFRVPVDWKSLGLLDYPTKIKKPMDLSTMKKKLSTKSYNSKSEFKQDFDLSKSVMHIFLFLWNHYSNFW